MPVMLMMLVTAVGRAVGAPWLRVDLRLVGAVWAVHLARRWWTRPEPQRRD